jgi:bifunctional N-acetylglucosamine-1-phosphate-uridyltransferase/glucosamine-1-phosphate-acetyltransferase GlmU-like protein
MITGIVLAGGKGTRINSKTANKVTLPFLNKPMILYGVELLHQVADSIIVVVGAFAESVKTVLTDYSIVYAYQNEQLGTGHAVKIALSEVAKYKEKPKLVLVGYGDHMMFYTVKNANDLIDYHQKSKAVMTIVTTILVDPHAYGRVIRDKNNNVIKVVEEKDATVEEKQIKEINAGLYCFDYQFLVDEINNIPKSPITSEYYITDLVKMAVAKNKLVAGLTIPYHNVGIGINKTEELAESQKIYLKDRS